jgi:hypothetical protein
MLTGISGTQRPVFNPSTGENNPGKRKASVIIRNRAIEILESDSNEESSPTLHVQGGCKSEGLMNHLDLKCDCLY